MKDSCSKYSVDLSAYFDGELEAEAESALQKHLKDCESCRVNLEKMRLIRSAMSGFGKGSVRGPGSVLESLRSRLAAEKGPRGKKNTLNS